MVPCKGPARKGISGAAESCTRAYRCAGLPQPGRDDQNTGRVARVTRPDIPQPRRESRSNRCPDRRAGEAAQKKTTPAHDASTADTICPGDASHLLTGALLGSALSKLAGRKGRCAV